MLLKVHVLKTSYNFQQFGLRKSLGLFPTSEQSYRLKVLSKKWPMISPVSMPHRIVFSRL